MRHIDNPLRCLHFGLGFLLFVRWMDHPMPVFKPEESAAAGGPGVQRRAWYGEFLIPGYNKGSPGRKVSSTPPPPARLWVGACSLSLWCLTDAVVARALWGRSHAQKNSLCACIPVLSS